MSEKKKDQSRFVVIEETIERLFKIGHASLITLPILKIDGIVVDDCFLYKDSLTYDLLLQINYGPFDNTSIIRIQTNLHNTPPKALLQEVVTKLKLVLEHLKFDELHSKFYYKKNIRTQEAWLEFFEECKNINDDCSCSVCYKQTSCKTTCGHLLCIRCAQKLTKKVCPVCRRVLLTTEDIYSEQIEEDEEEEDVEELEEEHESNAQEE